MPRGFYEPGEYIGALVYDSTGLLYGRVCGVDFEPKPRLRVCVEPMHGVSLPDPGELREKLRSRGLGDIEGEALEDLVVAAREHGVEAARVPAERLRGVLLGFVEPLDMLVVDETDQGGLVIVLDDARASRLRGVEAESSPKPDPGKVRGKPVISLGHGYLGVAETVSLGPRGVALRVARRLGGDVSRIAAGLESMGYRGVAEQLRRLSGGGEATAETLNLLESLLRSVGAPEEALRALASGRSVRVEKRDVPWEEILWVGEAVLVS